MTATPWRSAIAFATLVATLAAGRVLLAEEAPMGRGLSLAQAVKQALVRHPALSASRAGRDVSRARIAAARGAFFPRIDYAESFSRSDNPVYVFGTRLAQDRLVSQAAKVGAELADVGETRVRMGIIFETVRAYHGSRSAPSDSASRARC